MGAPLVALVLVSHSRLLAQGVVDVAQQMAPDVLLVPAGGTEDGRVGTAFDLVSRALDTAVADGRCAVVLTDLGSAALTTETVLELAPPDVVARVRVADAPFVEGAVEAAVVAQGGADLATVLEAAQDAATSFARSSRADDVGLEPESGGSPAGSAAGSPVAPAGGSPAGRAGEPAGTPAAAAAQALPAGSVTTAGRSEGGDRAAGTAPPHDPHASEKAGTPTARGTAVLRNRLGLHARPAAQVARTAAAFDAVITVNGADARSVLSLVGLGALGGHEVVVAATGPQARTAVIAVIDELENGFGEA